MPRQYQPRQYQSWEVSDDLWELVEPLVPLRQRVEGREYKRKPGAGRKPMAMRRVFEAIVFVLRTGIQWKALPREYGAGSAVHKYFQGWEQAGFFRSLWQAGLAEYDELVGIDWECVCIPANWQSIDGCKVESPLGQDAVGPNPVDRGKKRVGASLREPSLTRRRSRRTSISCDGGSEPA